MTSYISTAHEGFILLLLQFHHCKPCPISGFLLVS
uniref:Uncharacterized protein n=1 Tax=Anguilla anguilla TaxID=7936 RepID=A0A0E9S449_ANGAN